MRKSYIVVALVLLFLLLGIGVGFVLRNPLLRYMGENATVQTFFPNNGRKQALFSPLIPTLPPKRIIQVLKQTDKENRTLYRVRGQFQQKPAFQNDILVGNLLIIGDSSKTPVRVIMSARGGNFHYGTKESEKIIWELTETEKLANLLQSGVDYELTVYYGDKNGGESNREKMEELYTKQKVTPQTYVLLPSQIRPL